LGQEERGLLRSVAKQKPGNRGKNYKRGRTTIEERRLCLNSVGSSVSGQSEKNGSAVRTKKWRWCGEGQTGPVLFGEDRTGRCKINGRKKLPEGQHRGRSYGNGDGIAVGRRMLCGGHGE